MNRIKPVELYICLSCIHFLFTSSLNLLCLSRSGTNPLIRGLALRVMTSIRVSDIIQIQLLAVRKCATDTSPYVRKCAANAVPKIFSMVHNLLQYT